jgi:hypothetical protein
MWLGMDCKIREIPWLTPEFALTGRHNVRFSNDARPTKRPLSQATSAATAWVILVVFLAVRLSHTNFGQRDLMSAHAWPIGESVS